MKRQLPSKHLLTFLLLIVLKLATAQKVEGLKFFEDDPSYTGICYSLSTDTFGKSILVKWANETQNGLDPIEIVGVDESTITNFFGSNYGTSGNQPADYLPIKVRVDRQNNVYVSSIHGNFNSLF